jgi:hypothetical protein
MMSSLPTIEEAVLLIGRNCDGAATKDGIGFNKMHAAYGKEMKEKNR